MKKFTGMRSDGRVELKLYFVGNTDQVFWSKSGNSYVIVADPDGPWILNGCPCFLLSINGSGEVRWSVLRKSDSVYDVTTGEDMDAARYFNLTYTGGR